MRQDSYGFIYDDFLSDRQYERRIADIESRLVLLDLVGHVARLALFRSAKDLVESMVHQGVTTIVVIGNDRTLDKVMWFLPDLDVTLGYLPVAEPTDIAEILGIPHGIEACDVLAARLIEVLDVGRLDDRYFLTEVRLPQTIASINVEGQYRVSSINGGSISVRNLGGLLVQDAPQADAMDGLLEVVISPQEETHRRWRNPKVVSETRILIRHGEIISPDPVDAYADNHMVNGMHFDLRILPQKLRVITGRRRRTVLASKQLPKSRMTVTFPTATDHKS